MKVLNSIISWIMKKRIHQIELFTKYPIEMQEEVRRKLVHSARNTDWGKKYDYKSIVSARDFSERIPISNYEKLHPYIEQIMKGQQNVLWPSDIKWFAKSSGTTNDRSKFIPVSVEALEECHFKGGKDMISIYCNNYPESKMFTGKGLALGGSHQINQLNNESYYGDLSAVLMQNLPFWANVIRTPDLSIALMDNWEEKVEKLALSTMNENVTNIAGVPTWTIVLFKWILDYTGKSHIKEVWGNLELYIHGGVSFTPYREQFKKFIPSDEMHYLETYNASEGFFGIQDQTDSQEMLLMLDYGIYFEFLPVEEYESENPKILTLAEVELHKNYALVISTNAGLWRYLIGDTIRFTSLHPFRFQITGRTKHFINAFGEELIIENAEQGLKKACEATNAEIREYTAAPVFLTQNEKGGHEWAIEFSKNPTDINLFTTVLDNTLKQLNTDYEAKRTNDLAMVLPKINQVPDQTFYKWLKQKNKLGGQHKVPRLANNRKHLEEILASY